LNDVREILHFAQDDAREAQTPRESASLAVQLNDQLLVDWQLDVFALRQ
jgi:hypothetical protein